MVAGGECLNRETEARLLHQVHELAEMIVYPIEVLGADRPWILKPKRSRDILDKPHFYRIRLRGSDCVPRLVRRHRHQNFNAGPGSESRDQIPRYAERGLLLIFT